MLRTMITMTTITNTATNSGTNSRPKIHPIFKLCGKIWLKVAGWRADSELPDVPKAVFIAAPHTSNWDLPFALAVAWALGIKLTWVGKHTLFRFPFGGLMRALGGVPVDRSVRGNQVERMAALIQKMDCVYMAVAPSGTRTKRDHWKSGFYYIAKTASVPVLMAYLDYGKKVGGIGPLLETTDNIVTDMNKVRAFYETVTACYPESTSTPRLKEEAQAPG